MFTRLAPSRSAAALAAIWIGLVAGFAIYSLRDGIRQAEREVEETGRALHRGMSQRVAQHDAHLTSLSALAQAAQPMPLRELDQVASSIIRFYPRIIAVELIALAGADPVTGSGARLLASTMGPSGIPADPAKIAQATAGISPGSAAFLTDEAPDRYRLVKKSSDALALSLAIDARRLFDAEELPAWAALTLSADQRAIIALPNNLSQAAAGPLRTLAFEARLASTSQPLLLRLERPLSIASLIPVWPFAGFALTSLAIIWLAGLFLRQRRAVTLARAAAAEALRREGLRKHEAQLAHALRVNTMGELASGIAHELTQPLTALLSQSQAGQRLVAQSGVGGTPIADVLSANVRQAKCAADILARLRAYVSKSAVEPSLCDLNMLVSDIAALSRIDVERRGITLDLQLAPTPPMIWADPVEIEQVAHNLIRNDADALDQDGGEARRILVGTAVVEGEARLTVADTGSGIPADVLPRLFEPFFSTKPDGMGLGLPLCDSIVERFGGRIGASNREGRGAVFTVTLPLAKVEPRAEAAE